MKKAFVIILATFICQTAWAIKIDSDKISEKISESIQRAIQEAEENMRCPSNVQIALQSEGSYVVTVDLTLALTDFYDSILREEEEAGNCGQNTNADYNTPCGQILWRKQIKEGQLDNLLIKVYRDNDIENQKKCDPLKVSKDQDGYDIYTLTCTISAADSDWVKFDIYAILTNFFSTITVDRDCVSIVSPASSSGSENTDTSTSDTESNTDPAVRAPHDAFDSSNVSASSQDEDIPPDASGYASGGSGGSGKKGWFCSLNRNSGDTSLSAIGLLFLVLLVARFRSKTA